jgi:integrase
MPDGTTHVVNASGRTEAIARHRFQLNVRAAKLANRGVPAQSLEARCEQWLDEKRVEITAKSLHQYESALSRYVYPALGHRLFADIKTTEIQALITDLRSSGRLRSADFVRTVLKQMFSHSVRDGLLEVSPMSELRGQRKPKRAVLDEDGSAKAPLEIWRPEEVGAFIEALDGMRIREMLIVALFSGLRRGEVLTLRWEDVGPNYENVHVRRAYNEFEPNLVGPPKSAESVRKVPLGELARDALSLARQRRTYEMATKPGYVDEGWVFPSRIGSMLDARNYYRQFKRAIDRANKIADEAEVDGKPFVRVRDIRLHSLRHTYASYLARAGHPPSVIQRLLGHSTPDLALRVYTHVLDEDLTRASLDLSDILNDKKSAPRPSDEPE